ncbi:hypothetical protein MtrunA17_Chr7g0248941 [Medicago truncatula]|nr:hypothetical protein MtrunA17_Chr7g0248941 [Medicago truncatula]
MHLIFLIKKYSLQDFTSKFHTTISIFNPFVLLSPKNQNKFYYYQEVKIRIHH